MKIIIRTKNLTLTKELQDFVEEKIYGLKKFVDILKREDEPSASSGRSKKTLAEAFVDIERETKHHKKGKIFRAEAMILLPGRKIIAATRGDSLTGVIVKIKDELQQEIKKYKEKTIDFHRRKQKRGQTSLDEV